MKLRFEIDQADCFRRGIDAPKSIVTVDVDPAKLPVEDRNLIADRLVGIDVCQTKISVQILNSKDGAADYKDLATVDDGNRIMASGPTYEALILAVRKDDECLKKEAESLTDRHKKAQEYGQIVREALRTPAR